VSEFHRSSFSDSGNCVEVGRDSEGRVIFRNSRFPDGEMLIFTQAEWVAFLAGVKAEEFDAL
jgi:hypothetical protein